MKKIKVSLIASLVLLLILPVFSQAAEIKVAFAIGKVDYKKADQGTWLSIKKDMALTDQDVIRTGESATVLLQIDNLLKLKISPNTTLKLESIFPNTDVSFSGGKVWVDVTKLGSNRTFNIRTPSSHIGVRGTEFIYENGEKEDRVIVYDGIVGFGKNIKSLKEVHKGKIGILKGNEVLINDYNAEDDKNLKKDFPLVISQDTLRNSRRLLERYRFRDSIRRELHGLNLVRNVSRTKYLNDVTTGKTIVANGEVIRVQQYLRQIGPNGVQVVNVTSKNNFINVLEYIGRFSGGLPNTLSELIKLTQNNENEIYKKLTMVQKDYGKAGNDGRLILIDDKTSGTRHVYIDAVNDLVSPLNPVNALNDATADFTKLKRIGNNTYLTGTYTTADTGTITLKVTPIDSDGNPIMLGSVDGVDLDALSKMSFKIEFSGGSKLGTTVLTAYVLSDIGIVLINQ